MSAPASNPDHAAGRRMPPIASRGGAAAPWDWDGDARAYVVATAEAAYRVPLTETPGARLRIDGRLQGGEWEPLLRGAGMLMRLADGAVLALADACEAGELASFGHEVQNGDLTLRYEQLSEGRTLRHQISVRAHGGSLILRVEAPPGGPEGHCGFDLAPIGSPESRAVIVPGLPDPLLVLPSGAFAAAYADRFLGAASAYRPGGALYRPDLRGASLPIDETFYLTLSADPLGPLPSLEGTPAPYRRSLAGRLVLDHYTDDSYLDDARLFELLAAYGLRDLVLIYRNWQHFGYRQREPLLYPADPSRGRPAEFRAALHAAAEAGWLVALREEFTSVSRDSPYWSEDIVALGEDGAPRLSPRPGACALAADHMPEFVRLEATQIARNYETPAVFVDGHTAMSPETGLRQVDARPGSRVGTEARGLDHAAGLVSALRRLHGGPVIGAGGDGASRIDTLMAGQVEGVIRGVDGGRSGPLPVDYELREVRPALIGIGAGDYAQFSGAPAEPLDPARLDRDAYRATEIALGHAGYLGSYLLRRDPHSAAYPLGSAVECVREYYLLRALQELYVDAPVTSIRYRDGDEPVDLATALRRGLDLAQPRIEVAYANGLTVWVNRSSQGSWEVTGGSGRYVLPPSGFLAEAPRQGVLAYSAEIGGHRTDYCRCPAYTFLDVRSGRLRTVGELSTDGSAALLRTSFSGSPDVVLTGGRQVLVGDGEYLLSEPGDLRLSHLSEAEIELRILSTDSGKPAHATFPAFTEEWRRQPLRVVEIGGDRNYPSRCQATMTRSGPQLLRAAPGLIYRIRRAS